MSILRHFKRLQFIDYLIRKKATGNLNNFARKNQLSKRGLTKVLQEMKELGFPIKYSRDLECYYYEQEGKIVECLFMKESDTLPEETAQKLNAAGPHNLCFSDVTVFEVCKNTN